MLHAAGLVHEQSRSDRDKYIRLIKENLGGNIYNSNFDKDDTLDQNPYDYESIMQYGLRTFSINGKNTIEFLDKDLEFLAGTAAGEGISFYDIKDVIVNYQCAAHCKDPPACINGGFINHDCVCYCPRGYTGKTCETVITDNDCGGMVDVPPGDDVFVISPGYPAPYALGKICRWGVTV
uniref:Metalloendopeptidase n=1 Tax=Magallana gigas TaxID=29159 RepID=K1PS83_MAGGI